MWPKDNSESWLQIHEFIDEFPDDDDWSKWKPMARELVSDLERRGLIPYFRIGQSMHHIIFSTADHHGLTEEPRVTLEFHPNDRSVRIAYSRSNLYFNQPLADECVPFAAVIPRTLGYLQRLWKETNPSASIPGGLNVG
jgi:hypothetical protein